MYVRDDDPEDQAVDVVHHLQLVDRVRPLSRCLRCGGALAPVPKAVVADRLPARTRRLVDDFRRCDRCAAVYWPGAHRAGLDAGVARLVGRLSGPPVTSSSTPSSSSVRTGDW